MRVEALVDLGLLKIQRLAVIGETGGFAQGVVGEDFFGEASVIGESQLAKTGAVDTG